jgi:hypothetical protein
MITYRAVNATTNTTPWRWLSDAMQSPNGYAVRDVNGYQKASDRKSKIVSRSVASS